MEYQVTLLCTTGKYKPVSCIIKRKVSINLTDKVSKKALVNDGVVKICSKRGWTQRDLQRYNYTKVKVREYDKKKIEEEKRLRYDCIKEEKYASGEWKRPKNAEV